ncbi:hypothetical protein OJAV_G00198490 [Oryzias javanicus]|uniref:Mitochondrial import inner membrane translocase subunit Tim21 n=1 Tax=Oryzias javanicus TaxID=123683 RepID=A0A3S2NTF1_ORYJA|nr:hypothetical protein OJAV_G00198490 [Oryzias javanicus]
MAYTHILKAVQQSVRSSGKTCLPVQAGVFLFTRRTGALMHGATVHGSEAPPSALSCLCQTRRSFSLHVVLRNKRGAEEKHKSVSAYQSGSPKASSAQKVKDAGRDFTYLIVVLIGLGVTGGLLYVVFQELFSSTSPNKVYSRAFDKVKSHPEVIGAFGEPIKCYGETTRRGRRQQVSHAEYVKDGLKHMRLKFYIEGSEPGLKGTVHSESKENLETGKYEFRYVFVEIDTYPRRTIVVEDNR